MRAGAEPRQAALSILRAVRTGMTFDRALERALSGLETRDRRLAHEIAAGVLRERTALDLHIHRALAHPGRTLPADVHDILRIGAYQIRHLDRVPGYAVVQSAVELARSAGPRSAPLVNAVLRRLSREALDPPGEPQPDSNLADRFSHPGWLVDRWISRFGAERTELLLASNNRRPPLTIQPARWTQDRLLETMAKAGIRSRSLPADRGIVLLGIRDISTVPGFGEGGFIVQDPAQKQLLDYAAFPDGVSVWDACAAPGGKAALLSRTRRVFATDISLRRQSRLLDTVRRAAPTVTVVPADAGQPPWRPNTFGWVLVDAPCTGTGAIAGHPDARWRLTPEAIRESATHQAGVLAGAAATVRPGGILVYLTCSLESEENEQQIERFVANNPDFTRNADDLFVFPSNGNDGGYGARLKKGES